MMLDLGHSVAVAVAVAVVVVVVAVVDVVAAVVVVVAVKNADVSLLVFQAKKSTCWPNFINFASSDLLLS